MATRDPEATRSHILQSAYRAVYEQGLSATSLDQVLARAGVTKGALYHHFAGKKELGCALVGEVLAPLILAEWVEPLRTTNDPIGALQELLRRQASLPREDVIRFGCPLNNLAQEVSSLDEELRGRLEDVFARWVGALRDALARGQGAGTVRADLDPERAARFVVGAIEGAISLAKVGRDGAVLRGSLEELAAYLGTLRPAKASRKKR
ncbi:TetR/AcrR family transcriptional regulator [Anaeromyxobacter oryzae]|uniref:TetR family transcriptional regulator n=1 Tax=Anaeromyxobacter oryzae TaxID=2918170 RepID=A0ABM7WU08_9BACT|nr:TetR/AcrR family transcriptional regulator [Anaeromyxobacter oryzae]BDG02973.1 TetR family transcriptional regulator [Anaeromyxobacter oryzae]